MVIREGMYVYVYISTHSSCLAGFLSPFYFIVGKGLVAQWYPSLCNPISCNLPGSSVLGILQQEYWSGLPFPSPGDLLDPEMEPGSPVLQADSLPSEPPHSWKTLKVKK